jgi:polysaccharide pyruvyl transferase WcaK-like protein
MMKILVYGWYHQLNIGDDLFIQSFHKLFPTYQFVFCDHINVEVLQAVDAVFFGGGSFLLERPNIPADALTLLKTKPIFYIGVGCEAEINSTHADLIRQAKLIATRSLDQVDRLKILNPNTMWIPDLVYCLQDDVTLSPKKNRSVLVMPNISVVPHNLDPHWKHASWLHFKSEFSQFLDDLVKDGFSLNFLSMCRGIKDNDDWAASEMISHMFHRGEYILKNQPTRIEDVTQLISQYNLVITQRFHGIILSEMTKTPYIAIHHHDKLKYTIPCNGSFISYYNTSKHIFGETFDRTIGMKFSPSLPIVSNIFEALSSKVMELVENGPLCRS